MLEESSCFESSDFYPFLENLQSQVLKKEIIINDRERKLLAGIHVNFKSEESKILKIFAHSMIRRSTTHIVKTPLMKEAAESSHRVKSEDGLSFESSHNHSLDN